MALSKNFNKDIKEMQRLFDHVKHGYDLYFAGGSKEPPTKDAMELDMMVRWYRNQGQATLAQQFLFSSFLNKYALHAEQWKKWLRSREEGIAVDPRLPGSVRRARRELMDLEKTSGRSDEERDIPAKSVKKTTLEPAAAKSTPAAAKHESSEAGGERRLYDQFVEAHLACGSVPKWDYKGFRKHLAVQKKAIQEKYKGRDISFSVTRKDGKVKLKAKVKKKK